MSDINYFDLRVVDRQVRADQVTEFVLAPVGGAPLPAWGPGAHISLQLQPGLERQYSLCGGLDNRETWRIAVLRESHGRGGSAYLHDNVKVGGILHCKGPRNHFPLDVASSYIFIAGGIGITPIIPMIEQTERWGVSWTLYYGGRSRASMAYLPELAAFSDRVHIIPQDDLGVLDLATITPHIPSGCLVYACGPEGLLNALVDRSAAWPKDTLHVERFSPIVPDPRTVSRPFTVHLRASAKSICVGVDETILGAMVREGLRPPSSCKEGTCGTCETRVLSGAVDHRDSVLSPSEREAGNYMMICVSRARGDEIELDA
ncbi:PDR/VanB family oxidoreductase [Bradyrhizobium manausense]